MMGIFTIVDFIGSQEVQNKVVRYVHGFRLVQAEGVPALLVVQEKVHLGTGESERFSPVITNTISEHKVI